MKEEKNISINWFPGHMKKASNQIDERLKFVDLVIFMLDSRAIISSLNPYLLNIVKNKKKLFVISKKDLANENENKLWEEKLKSSGDLCLLCDLKNNKTIDEVLKAIDILLKEKKEKNSKKGIVNFSIKAMVIGIPNVGKSTFINLMAKKALAKAENRPGLTRSLTWIKVNKNFELLDTPGILLPKFESIKDAINLALIGTIKEDILPLDELFDYFITIMKSDYNSLFLSKYGFDLKELTSEEIAINLAKKRGFLLKNNELDILRSKKVILSDFKNGKIGRITLEKSKDYVRFGK